MEAVQSIGLALGGGGAKGLAHIGVLNVLREAGISVGGIAGTSMGALVGGFYAATGDLTLLEETFRSVTRRDLVSSLALLVRRNGALFTTPRIQEAIESALRGVTIESCATPFRAVATDAETGEMVVLDSGNLLEAIRASIALPVAFSPVRLGDRMLIDGGFVNPVPADVARAMGATVVVAVDVSTQWVSMAGGFTKLRDAYTFLSAAHAVFEYQVARPILRTADVIIRPRVLQHDWRDFDHAEEIIRAGEDAARGELSRIRTVAHYPEPPRSALDRFLDLIAYPTRR